MLSKGTSTSIIPTGSIYNLKISDKSVFVNVGTSTES